MSQLYAIDKTTTPLVLLRKVRDVMRASEKPQTRLNKLVKVIARGFDSQVCSIYFARAGDMLELYATQGLKQEAVHKTRLRIGEGLVGEIAALSATLNLPEATHHPKFAYRAETGEDAFHSLCGVPILYNHRVIGVLVVQSVDAKIYSEEQIEILQTIAMVLAELAIASQVVELKDITGEADNSATSHYYSGLKLAPGLAKANVILHRPKIEIGKLVSDDPAFERERLHKAVQELQESVETIIRNAALVKGDTKLEILEAYRMFTHDKGWLERIEEAIHTGLTADAAVKRVQEQMYARMSRTGSAYIRERIHDLDDLSTRLLYHLAGISPTAAQSQLPSDFILVAKSIGPAELLEYSNKGLQGVMLEEGSATSHVAIIARMMDIPMISRIPDVVNLVQKGDLAIIDGDNGEAYIRPPDDVVHAIDEHIATRKQRDAEYESQRDLPALSLDEQRVSLNLNIGLYLDAAQLSRPDVEGIGLYRTELPYLASSDIPDVDEQKKMYGEIFRHAKGKRVVFRSFDIGGDKQVPYVQVGSEENPAMGWRATRIGLDRPVILRRQFRALIRAAGGQVLHIMFPFIADIGEFDETRAILDRELERAKVEGQRLPTEVKVGSMIEIPSLLFQLPALLKKVDFVSVGSNDLLQFLYACDRGSERLSGRYDPLSPVFMGIIRQMVQQCDEAEVELGFCGAMASKPVEAMALLGCGVRNISVPPAAIGPVKVMIRSLNIKELQGKMAKWVKLPEHSLRSQIEAFAKAHNVPL